MVRFVVYLPLEEFLGCMVEVEMLGPECSQIARSSEKKEIS